MTVLRQSTLRVAGVGLTWLYTLYRVHPAVWRLMARNYRPWMGRFARLHAWMTCQFAWRDVPAYRAHLQRGGWEFRWFRLGSYPPTSKQNYVAAFPEEQRCRRGELEIEGSVVDESSGSSGRPFNWVRSRRELRSVPLPSSVIARHARTAQLFLVRDGAGAVVGRTSVHRDADLDRKIDPPQAVRPHRVRRRRRGVRGARGRGRGTGRRSAAKARAGRPARGRAVPWTGRFCCSVNCRTMLSGTQSTDPPKEEPDHSRCARR
jgi:hypothetical protein